MIKHFSAFYVGQIELENIGADGTPPDSRRYPNERLVESFQMAEELAVLMDGLGYYALWGGRAPFSARRLRVSAQSHPSRDPSRSPHEAAQIWLWI